MRRGYIILLWICERNNGNLVCIRFYVQIANTNLLSWEKYTLFLPLLFLSLKTKLQLDFAISSSIVDVKFKPLVSLHFATLQLFFKLLAQPSSCNSMCWTGNMGHSSLTSSCPLHACQDCLKAISHTVFCCTPCPGRNMANTILMETAGRFPLVENSGCCSGSLFLNNHTKEVRVKARIRYVRLLCRDRGKMCVKQ